MSERSTSELRPAPSPQGSIKVGKKKKKKKKKPLTRKEVNVLFNDAHILFTAIWCRTYGKD